MDKTLHISREAEKLYQLTTSNHIKVNELNITKLKGLNIN